MIDEDDVPPGLPAWIATFADLMSLLMCFFILLLSFSEMDVQKYKLVAGSMKNAFGVQQEVIAQQSPSGAADVMEDIKQEVSGEADLERRAMIEKLAALMAETAEDVEELEESLEEEIQGGFVDLESGFRSITIRIMERGSFGSGSADLQEQFLPVMERLRTILKDIEGKISIEGHTDNIGISTQRFQSNWALSSARALSVAHELLRDDVIVDERFIIVGYSDTKPITDNDSPEGRASNRRVEIVIRQPVSDEVSAGLQTLEESDPELVEMLSSPNEESPTTE